MLNLNQLEDRLNLSTVNILSGLLSFANSIGETNNVTVSVASNVYTIKDTNNIITLGAGAVASGWRGNGTHQVSGTALPISEMEFSLDDGFLNIRSIADPIMVDGGSGNVQINVNSTAPTGAGNLNGIAAEITVNAGSDTWLWVSDLTGTTRPNSINITQTSITGLSPFAINLNGILSTLRVTGSTSTTLVENYTIDSPPCLYFKLETGGGDDTVDIVNDVTGDFFLGSGNDTLTVEPGMTLNGNVNGANTIYYGAPTWGTITGSVT